MTAKTRVPRPLQGFLTLWAGQSVSQLGSAMTAYALVVWSYTQSGRVMSVALLLICNLLPAALLSPLAGALVDRLPKKAVMLASDFSAACVTLAVAVLSASGRLRVEHLYLINALLGALGAFQSPAADVAVSALSPREQYMRVSGLQSLSGSLRDILSPVLATAAMAFGGLRAVLIIDLSTFLFAFSTLLMLKMPAAADAFHARAGEGFWRQMRGGLVFLRKNRGIRIITGYQMLLNLISGIGYYSVLRPMILLRAGGDEMQLGAVNACIGLGALAGAALLSLRPPRSKSRVKIMCFSFMLSFLLCDALLGVGRTLPVWCAAAFLGSLPLPWGDGALSTLLRENVPIDTQGRVFAARGMLIKVAIMAGYLAGAVLADSVAERVFALDNPLSAALRAILGTGEGRAMGMIFLFTCFTGVLASLSLLRFRAVRALDTPKD